MTTLFERVATIREVREKARHHLPFMKNPLDMDIALEIVFHQLAGSPLTVKALKHCGIASEHYVGKRLARLYGLGVVTREPSKKDGRARELRLSAEVQRQFVQLFGEGA